MTGVTGNTGSSARSTELAKLPDIGIMIGGEGRYSAMAYSGALRSEGNVEKVGDEVRYRFAPGKFGRAILKGNRADPRIEAFNLPLCFRENCTVDLSVSGHEQGQMQGANLELLTYDVDQNFLGLQRLPVRSAEPVRFTLDPAARAGTFALRLQGQGVLAPLIVKVQGEGIQFFENRLQAIASAVADPAEPAAVDGPVEADRPTPARDASGAPGLSAVRPGSIEHLTLLLTNMLAETGDVRRALTSALSGNPLAIAQLIGRHRRGTITIAPKHLSIATIFAVRSLARLNAYESSYRLAEEFLASDAVAEMNEPDLRRLNLAYARSAQRSGRAETALELYRSILVRKPDSEEALIGYVASIIGTSPALAATMLEGAIAAGIPLTAGNRRLMLEMLLKLDRPVAAMTALYGRENAKQQDAEAQLALSNIFAYHGDRAAWLDCFKAYSKSTGLRIEGFDADQPMAPFAFRCGPADPILDTPKIAVVMTCFNAEATVRAAAASVLAQTVRNLELTIIDDLSTDGSREIIRDLAAADPRVRVLFNERNMGTYASKNQAIRTADADFVTFHDSDDWMHPDRLHAQLQALGTSSVVCSTSNWLRMSADGRVKVQRSGSYAHLNPSSTFVRTPVLQACGGFDEVRTGADAEFHARLKLAHGAGGIVSLPTALGIGFHHEASLTQAGAAAFDEHRYSPVRLAYTEAWTEWHLSQHEAGVPELGVAPPAEAFERPHEIAS